LEADRFVRLQCPKVATAAIAPHNGLVAKGQQQKKLMLGLT
jgi:hypothetical protein